MPYQIDGLLNAVQHSPMFQTDSEGGIFARQLVTATLAEIWRMEYPVTKWASGELCPLNTNLDEGAGEFSYLELEHVGEAAIVPDNATNATIPRADVTGQQTLQGVHTVAIGFSYTDQEIRKARMQGMFDVVSEKADAARGGHDRTMNKLIRGGGTGDDGSQIPGFVNHSGIIVMPSETTNWMAATAEQIVSSFSQAGAFMKESSDNVEQPNTAVFPVNIFTRLTTVKNSVSSDITILDFLKKAWPMITTWTDDAGMSTAGTGGTPAVMIYNRDAKKARAVIPMLLAPLSAQADGLNLIVNMRSRYGGVMMPRPRAVIRLEGVGPA